MSPNLDQLIEWVLGELSRSPQGTTISELFQRIDKHATCNPEDAPLDRDSRNLLWATLIAREDINFGEGTSSGALKKLSLDDVLGLGLGERALRLRIPAGPDNASNSQVSVAIPNFSGVVATKEPLTGSIEQTNEPPKSRRKGQSPGKPNEPKQDPSPRTELSSLQGGQTVQSIPSISGSRPGTPLGSTTAENELSPQQTPTRASTPKAKRGRPSLGTYVKKATFTPYEKVQREEDDAKIEAGIPGVYINPTVSQVKIGREANEKRPKKQMIAVFKSNKLKIHQWLGARKGTWKEPFAKRVKSDPSSISHSAVANIAHTHGSTPLTQSPPNGEAGTLLQPNGSNALPAMNIAGPPHQNNVDKSVYIPSTAQHVTQLGTTGPQQAGYPISHTFNQLSASYPVAGYQIPPQPTYKSPYSSTPPSTSQLGIPPVDAPTYKSPYQSPYQPINPPPTSTAQPQRLPNLSDISGATPSNIQTLLGNGNKVKASTSTSTLLVAGEEKRKRKAPKEKVTKPNKRQKSVLAEPIQHPSVAGSPCAAVEAPTEATPENALLEAILKQQEEEKAKEAQRERELQDKLSAAQLSEVPEHLVRLTAAYENTVGNLILSLDQTTLSFLGVEQLPPKNVIWTLPISTIFSNPVVSMAGSKPMELRVKSRDGSGVEIIHGFNIGQTEPARKAADVMRAKLVLAKINIRTTAAGSPYASEDELDDAEIEALKPFLCEKCGKRFKNKEGIVYHRTKSQTTCNPKFDPSVGRTLPWARTAKKKKVKIIEPSPETDEKPEEEKEDEDRQSEADSSDDSLGSIIEWAEKASRPQRQSTSTRNRRGRSNLSDEGQPSVSIYSNEGDSDKVSVHSSDEERSSDDDFYPPAEEKTPQFRKRAMQERWARSKALGGNTLLGDETLQGKSSQSTPKIVRTPLTEEEKERRVAMSARRQQCWNTAPSFLPNIYTSAWDERPERVKKIHRKYKFRYELPEPTTFMQSEDGAWSIRPFGHGVKPIYARPTRRADGNPFLPLYLKRIESGFRPIVMPTKNRLLYPAAPAKRLLADPTAYIPPPSIEDLELAGKRTRRQRRAPRQSMSSKDGEDSDSDVRISKATGKPVRSYRRGYELVSKGARSRGGENVDKQNLDQIHVLNSVEPKILDPARGRLLNPGLDSLPLRFGLGLSRVSDHRISETPGIQNSERLPRELPVTFSLSDIIVDSVNESQHRMLSDIDQVAAWEQGRGSEFLPSGTLQPDYRWVNHALGSLPQATDFQHVKINWDENRSFDMLTLPYAELDGLGSAALFAIPPAPEYKVPRSSLKPASRDARDLRELHKGWTTRRLTALSSDLAGLGESPEKIAKELGTQIVLPTSVSRARKGDPNLSEADEARLIVGVCVLRILTGGLDQNIDWVLVSTLFNNYSMNFLTKRWTALFQKKRVVIEKLMADFQEAFLPAYRSGEIPPLDYDNLIAYDWNWLVQWAMKKVDTSAGAMSIELPDTRERLNKLYHITEPNDDNSRQESYFSLTYPVYKRMEMASSAPNTLPTIKQAEATCADDIKIDTFTVVKSWVRAAALTPDEVWDPRTMKIMLKSLNDPRREDKRGNDPFIKKLVDDAANILKSEKVLMQKNKTRATPERTYEPTDVFFGGLRKHVTVQQFVDAARFKYHLDQEFSRGVHCVRSDYLANEGTLMCVTHLQAHGRIRMQPVGIPMNKFGLGEGSYETRKIPKEKFRFDMDIYPTAKYIHDTDNEVLSRLKGTNPPRGSKMGELPVWYGIGDQLILSLWQRVLVAFAGIIALRAGSPIGALKKIFKPTLEEWEIWRLLEWGIENGVFVKLHEMVGGWTTGEWWWLVVGWCCAGAADAT